MKKTMMISSLAAIGLVAAGGATASLATTRTAGPPVLSTAEVQNRLAVAPPAAAAAKPATKPGRVTSLGFLSASASVKCQDGKMTDLRLVPRPGWTLADTQSRTKLKAFNAERLAVVSTYAKGQQRDKFAVYCVNNGAWAAFWNSSPGRWGIPETTAADLRNLGPIPLTDR